MAVLRDKNEEKLDGIQLLSSAVYLGAIYCIVLGIKFKWFRARLNFSDGAEKTSPVQPKLAVYRSLMPEEPAYSYVENTYDGNSHLLNNTKLVNRQDDDFGFVNFIESDKPENIISAVGIHTSPKKNLHNEVLSVTNNKNVNDSIFKENRSTQEKVKEKDINETRKGNKKSEESNKKDKKIQKGEKKKKEEKSKKDENKKEPKTEQEEKKKKEEKPKKDEKNKKEQKSELEEKKKKEEKSKKDEKNKKEQKSEQEEKKDKKKLVSIKSFGKKDKDKNIEKEKKEKENKIKEEKREKENKIKEEKKKKQDSEKEKQRKNPMASMMLVENTGPITHENSTESTNDNDDEYSSSWDMVQAHRQNLVESRTPMMQNKPRSTWNKSEDANEYSGNLSDISFGNTKSFQINKLHRINDSPSLDSDKESDTEA